MTNLLKIELKYYNEEGEMGTEVSLTEMLKDLNDYINDKNNKFKGIALRNINRRLKLNYGEQYGLEIFSVLGKGTSMVLTLPYIVR